MKAAGPALLEIGICLILLLRLGSIPCAARYEEKTFVACLLIVATSASAVSAEGLTRVIASNPRSYLLKTTEKNQQVTLDFASRVSHMLALCV